MDDWKHGAAIRTLLGLFDVATVEEMGSRIWHGETISSTQAQLSSLRAAQAELEQQKRTILSRSSSTSGSQTTSAVKLPLSTSHFDS
jgi:hypothetical protein